MEVINHLRSITQLMAMLGYSAEFVIKASSYSFVVDDEVIVMSHDFETFIHRCLEWTRAKKASLRI